VKMEKQQLKIKNVIKNKTFQFSLRIINLTYKLPNNYSCTTVGRQLLRSATSIGANVVEAQTGRTRRDFINYYQIALKSANETKYWLQILAEIVKIPTINIQIMHLLRNAHEICKILGASLLTLKGKRSV